MLENSRYDKGLTIFNFVRFSQFRGARIKEFLQPPLSRQHSKEHGRVIKRGKWSPGGATRLFEAVSSKGNLAMTSAEPGYQPLGPQRLAEEGRGGRGEGGRKGEKEGLYYTAITPRTLSHTQQQAATTAAATAKEESVHLWPPADLRAVGSYLQEIYSCRYANRSGRRCTGSCGGAAVAPGMPWCPPRNRHWHPRPEKANGSAADRVEHRATSGGSRPRYKILPRVTRCSPPEETLGVLSPPPFLLPSLVLSVVARMSWPAGVATVEQCRETLPGV